MAHSDHYASPQNSRGLTSLAWGITLLVSTLPDIAWVEFNGQAPNWLTLAKMGLLLTLSLAACFCKTLRPLRNYVIVMLAFFGLFELRPHVDFTWPALQAVCGNSVFDVRMQAEQTSKLAIAFAMVIVLVLLGYKRRDFFLARGHLRAPIKPVPLLGLRSRPLAPPNFVSSELALIRAIRVKAFLSPPASFRFTPGHLTRVRGRTRSPLRAVHNSGGAHSLTPPNSGGAATGSHQGRFFAV